MKFVMSYSICQRKYLLWAVFDDNGDDNEFINFKINEFRVCDCFLEWTVRFRNLSKDVIFSEEIITDFFDAVPTEMVGYDVFSLFGEITILCCKNALYHFLYKEDLDHDKLADECLGYDIDMRCMYIFERNFNDFSCLCSNCQFNFIKMVSNRFIKLKND